MEILAGIVALAVLGYVLNKLSDGRLLDWVKDKFS